MSANREAITERQREQAALERARIDLARATVHVPVNGIVTNFSLRPGSYALAGESLMALIDNVPPDIQLIVGRTASVVLDETVKPPQ